MVLRGCLRAEWSNACQLGVCRVSPMHKFEYFRTHNVRVCLYIAYTINVWFRFAIYRNAVLFFLYFGAVSGGYCR